MNDKISGWVRQSRHRAKKHGITNRLSTADVKKLIAAAENRCAYCAGTATTLDHPFQLGTGAPNVLANVLPCCAGCKARKGNSDLIQFLNGGGIDRAVFVTIITDMLSRDGGGDLRNHVKNVTGIGL